MSKELVDLIAFIAVLIFGGIGFYAMHVYHNNELFQSWNEQFKTDEERE